LTVTPGAALTGLGSTFWFCTIIASGSVPPSGRQTSPRSCITPPTISTPSVLCCAAIPGAHETRNWAEATEGKAPTNNPATMIDLPSGKYIGNPIEEMDLRTRYHKHVQGTRSGHKRNRPYRSGRADF